MSTPHDAPELRSCITYKKILLGAVKAPRYRKMKGAKEADDIRKHYGKFKWSRTIGGDEMILDYRLWVYFCQGLS
jgi:hypothetical protein